jgi:hypothetical protein
MQHAVIHNHVSPVANIHDEQRLVAVPVPQGTSQTGTLLVVVKHGTSTATYKATGPVVRVAAGYPTFSQDVVSMSGSLDLEIISDGMVQAGSYVGYLDFYATGIPDGASVDTVFSM